jgi:hypothetical protein
MTPEVKYSREYPGNCPFLKANKEKHEKDAEKVKK